MMRGVAGARPAIPNLAGGAGSGPLPPGQDRKTASGQGGDINNNVTVNQASNNPANDVVHALNVHAQNTYQNNAAMGR